MINYYKRFIEKRKLKKIRKSILTVLHSDMSRLDKCNIINNNLFLFNNTKIDYKKLEKYYIEFYVLNLAQLVINLKLQLQWMYDNDGYCNPSFTLNNELNKYQLSTWCIADNNKINFINLRHAWFICLEVINKINNYSNKTDNLNYLNKCFVYELDTFIKISIFLLEEIDNA